MSLLPAPLDRSLIYLATPYSKYPGGIERAFVDACRLAGRVLKAGYQVYSPIAHTHPIAFHAVIDPMALDIWLPFDAAMMERADIIWVAMMPTWQESRGIAHEIACFRKACKPVRYLDPDTLDTYETPVGRGAA